MISGPTSDNVIDNKNSSDDDMDGNRDITLRKAKPRCNHCNEKFSICLSHLHTLHKHLVEAHPDKLSEAEENEVKFHWIWDYYIAKSNTEASCKLCKVIVRCKTTNCLNRHLKRDHEISGPTSDNVIDNENSSDDDMDANRDITLRKAKRANFISVRRWIRGHYTKLTRSNKARCSHCTDKFIIHFTFIDILHKHLINAHPDKLTEEEKKEVKFRWTWDYFTQKGDTEATCKECKKIIKYRNTTQLKLHLKGFHM
ncbi:hypothetical protein ALC60_12726 [Trachymyrmex zeteki]|uniref:BED-type domain-containing protein n=1 Tax=Mycetomoellerius zeteki TaxID=64791 RepID=A0A151WK82_9HYME|nr:hypothetical protein ALC60_12726 [Trachymyrmex zeteki]